MKTIDSLKSKAINAVKVDKRLIADVAKEFGISRRKLFTWLNQKNAKCTTKHSKNQPTSISNAALKSQINTLQNEVQQLKTDLKQYRITERLVNGRITLNFDKKTSPNTELQKVG